MRYKEDYLIFLIKEVDFFKIKFDGVDFKDPYLIGYTKNFYEYSARLYFDEQIYAVLENSNKLKIRPYQYLISIKNIVSLLNIDYNKIDFSEVINAFNTFETFKKQVGDFYLEFL